ncbi:MULTISPECIES: amidohydrolase family protein [Ramlibacter]|uniref:Amidohydrolase family protein n=1 Tax=Ramlibacter pinisoli TaxID=2682844 RepID=A0A6N8J274_9BURK|nr:MULTISPECIES: amidohydrolase family protein [Ramlibacter]MBA2962354.1 amidohydrolase family protein [Ramlibacter sp. CGMCC 1.13660]MVQ32296.1 amidohydrolase family protein [Ramlibacter pinisoli]
MSQVPWSAGASLPALRVPPGSVDAHHHIYDARFPYDAHASLRPPPATVADYQRLQRKLGLARSVVVQPSSYGTDNRCLVDALQQLGTSARGVAVIDSACTHADLEDLDRAGVRGIRFNLSRPAGAAVESLQVLAERIAPLGWHVQVHALGPAYLQLEDVLSRLPVTLVIDHLGRVDPASPDRDRILAVLRRLADNGRTWIKVSGAYHDTRTGAPSYADTGAMARDWLARYPERTVWGTDWPHPSAVAGEKVLPDDAALLDCLGSWLPAGTALERLLVGNPSQLYGFDAPVTG